MLKAQGDAAVQRVVDLKATPMDDVDSVVEALVTLTGDSPEASPAYVTWLLDILVARVILAVGHTDREAFVGRLQSHSSWTHPWTCSVLHAYRQIVWPLPGAFVSNTWNRGRRRRQPKIRHIGVLYRMMQEDWG